MLAAAVLVSPDNQIWRALGLGPLGGEAEEVRAERAHDSLRTGMLTPVSPTPLPVWLL
jgi:hypothetical protein